MRRAALLLVALFPALACNSVVQPGLIDPGGVHARDPGDTTVSLHTGGLAEGILVINFAGAGGGGAFRALRQLDDDWAVGGEVFGGVGTLRDPVAPLGTVGARGIVDVHTAKNGLIRLGASGSIAKAANSPDLTPIAILDATFAFAPADIDVIEPYGFVGLGAGAMFNQGELLPIGGVHGGGGVRAAVTGSWDVHAGAVVESRTILILQALPAFSFITAMATVGASYTF